MLYVTCQRRQRVLLNDAPTANAPDEKETSAYNWEMERNC